ncbi:MAG: iron-sulfur cluster assembly accessory protein [Nitrospirae bacterium]|nr:iron-sulfur cluster assembly accessory protein [Nitrospirota bacterium]
MKLTITEGAAKFMRRMVRFGGGDANAAFRLAVAPGGCAGLSYDFTVEGTPVQGDTVVQAAGLTLCVPPESVPYLDGLVIDFVDTLASSGLTFTNPNAAGSCGCGSSFAVEGFTPPPAATCGNRGQG